MLLSVLLPLFSPVHASPSLLVNLPAGSDEPGKEPGSPEFWYRVIISVGLVLLGGVFAGYAPFICGLSLCNWLTFVQSHPWPNGPRPTPSPRPLNFL